MQTHTLGLATCLLLLMLAAVSHAQPRSGAPILPQPQAVAPSASSQQERPPADGDLRLVDQAAVNGYVSGLLQMASGGAFGSVCAGDFDDADAAVACRQMGFVGGAFLREVGFRLGSDTAPESIDEALMPPAVFGKPACTGEEERLADCSVDVRNDYNDYGAAFPVRGCDALSPTYIACGTIGNRRVGALRLAGSVQSADGQSEYGRLELFNEGGWGTICDTGEQLPLFPPEATLVACRSLGYSSGVAVQPDVPLDEQLLRVPLWLGRLASCTGAEASLLDCLDASEGQRLGDADRCTASRNLLLLCTNGDSDSTAETAGALRLREGGSGAGFAYGRLEVFVRGFWSTVCDADGFTPDSAQVACRALGYDGGAALKSKGSARVEYLSAMVPPGLAAVDCEGTEASLRDCPSSQQLLHRCNVPNSNLTDATLLACADTDSPAPCTPPNGTVAPAQGDVRLRGGFGTPCDPLHSGFVEVFNAGEWGALCGVRGAPRFDDTNVADVVCRQIGFSHGSAVDGLASRQDDPQDLSYYAYLDYSFDRSEEEADEAQERFWLAEVECRGSEERLLDCASRGGFLRRSEDCVQFGFGNSLRVHVACHQFAVGPEATPEETAGAEDNDLRLVDQGMIANWVYGRLEVFFDGQRDAVCADGFTHAAAARACAALGIAAGSRRAALPMPVFQQCRAGVFDSGFTLACITETISGVEGAVRLVDGAETQSGAQGIPEVFHAGAWGRLCVPAALDPPFSPGDANITFTSAPAPAPAAAAPERTISAATVACRQLGLPTATGILQPDSLLPAPLRPPPWVLASRCPPSATTLADCGPLAADTDGACASSHRLVCISASESRREELRLTGGQAAADGSWAYGLLEVRDGSFFSGVAERVLGSSRQPAVGRLAARVACRSLGFGAGAKLLSGRGAVLTRPPPKVATVGTLRCLGTEASLAECNVTAPRPPPVEAPFTAPFGATLLCVTPSKADCPGAAAAPPQQGDVRLVALAGTTTPTNPCDAVHFGGIEVYNSGRWGRICSGRDADIIGNNVLAARVICRQLGFPFSSLYDAKTAANPAAQRSTQRGGSQAAPAVVWSESVSCTGAEERLEACAFEQDLDESNMVRPLRAPAGAAAAACGRDEDRILAVACRRFAMPESATIQ